MLFSGGVNPISRRAMLGTGRLPDMRGFAPSEAAAVRQGARHATPWRRTCASGNDPSSPLRTWTVSGRPFPSAIEMTSFVRLGATSFNELHFH